ncbi:MAG: helix-turn-helix domain-containing protein, partial [Planktothrix sp.]
MNTRKKQVTSEKTLQEGKASLKTIREAMEMTQFDLCKATDLLPGSVSRCENGHSEILFDINQAQKFDDLIRLHLGISIHDLPKSL